MLEICPPVYQLRSRDHLPITEAFPPPPAAADEGLQGRLGKRRLLAKCWSLEEPEQVRESQADWDFSASRGLPTVAAGGCVPNRRVWLPHFDEPSSG